MLSVPAAINCTFKLPLVVMVVGVGVEVGPLGVFVLVGVEVGVFVRVGVEVGPAGVFVRVDVKVGVGVLVDVGLTPPGSAPQTREPLTYAGILDQSA